MGRCPLRNGSTASRPSRFEFVRINGNRVIRVEIAKVGEPPVIFTKDEVEGMMRTDGTPLVAGYRPTRTRCKMGDVERDPDTQAPAPPPSLRAPGETCPDDTGQNQPGAMKPVQFPKQKPDDYPDVEAARRADQQKAAERGRTGADDQKDTTQSGTSRPQVQTPLPLRPPRRARNCLAPVAPPPSDDAASRTES